jgi:hypothetical protein
MENTTKLNGKFILHFLDTFAGEGYDDMSKPYATEAEAREAAKNKLLDIKALQPDSSSGGQGVGGIQDRIYIKFPDEHYERYQ